MAAIHDPIAQIGDECLRVRLEAEWALFGRIQLIRKRKVAGGAEPFVRLEINRQETMQKLLLLSQAAQLDALFDGVH